MAMMENALIDRDRELRQKFVEDHDTIHVQVLSADIYEQLVRAILKDVSAETHTQESYQSSSVHRGHSSGIVEVYTKSNERTATSTSVDSTVRAPLLPHPVQLELERLWLGRKEKFQALVDSWGEQYAKLRALRLELERREEIRRQQEEERQRIEQRQREMLAEERLCRKFYLEESVLCMRERKAMATAEIEMREYLRALEAEAMKAKYAKMVEERHKTNDKAARRLEIKLGKNEQHRLYREWAQIRVEDVLSMQYRDQYLAEEQAAAMAQLVERFMIQQAANGKIAAELEASRLAERLAEAKRVAAEAKAAWEAKLTQERMMASVETYHRLASAELEWMNAVERVAFWATKREPLQTNLPSMKVELLRILSEKDHVVADAKAKREHAEFCKQRARETDAELREALQREERCQKEYRKIHTLNATMDSAVIHGRPQLFSTRYIRDQLQVRYFYLLTESIIRRAIVECNEREAQRLQTKLEQLEHERAFKIKEIGVLKRKRRRSNRMQLRRAELGKLMFGGTQKRLIKEMFHRWVQLWTQRVKVRAAFEVKHGLLMQQQRLKADQQKEAETQYEGLVTKLSILHVQQKRHQQCRLCKKAYTEEQNNRYACSYHPGAYELACISSCPTRQTMNLVAAGGGSGLTSACMLHRAKRWLCCDQTEEGRYGSNGCRRRYHLPVRDNPALKELVSKKDTEEKATVETLDAKLKAIKERDVVGKAKQATKRTIDRIEQELRDKRAVAAKYFTLDRRS
ncbi:hypothetical protein PINS_up000389 [Pythium insidiosum]|nr:hypothetical protein PINS_up000389 [Pythium insidiosum]